jgi:hypothetical protein
MARRSFAKKLLDFRLSAFLLIVLAVGVVTTYATDLVFSRGLFFGIGLFLSGLTVSSWFRAAGLLLEARKRRARTRPYTILLSLLAVPPVAVTIVVTTAVAGITSAGKIGYGTLSFGALGMIALVICVVISPSLGLAARTVDHDRQEEIDSR